MFVFRIKTDIGKKLRESLSRLLLREARPFSNLTLFLFHFALIHVLNGSHHLSSEDVSSCNSVEV